MVLRKHELAYMIENPRRLALRNVPTDSPQYVGPIRYILFDNLNWLYNGQLRLALTVIDSVIIVQYVNLFVSSVANARAD